MKKLLVAVLFSGVAFAGSDWKTLDKDANGSVTAEEAAGDAELTAHFATLDKDADGKLTAEEYKAHAAGHHGKKGHDTKKAK